MGSKLSGELFSQRFSPLHTVKFYTGEFRGPQKRGVLTYFEEPLLYKAGGLYTLGLPTL